MSDAVVKMEESVEIDTHPTKEIVSKCDDENVLLEAADDCIDVDVDDDEVDVETDETRDEDIIIKREGDTHTDDVEERDTTTADSSRTSSSRPSSEQEQRSKKTIASSSSSSSSEVVARPRTSSNANSSSSSNHSSGNNSRQHPPPIQQQQHPPQSNGARYYPNSGMAPNAPPGGPRGGPPFPMSRGGGGNGGYGGHHGGPPPYGGYHGGNYGPPPPPHYHHPPPPPPHHHHHPHHHPHMMPGGPYGSSGPYNPANGGGMKGNYHPPPMPYGGGPGPYGMPPSYPPHHGMNPNYPNGMNSQPPQPPQSDSNSTSSKSSMNSKKKRTIEGMQHHHPHNKLPTSYSFRRSDSNSSAASTATAGNNTSTETHHTEDSHHRQQQHPHHSKRSSGCESALSSLRMGSSSNSSSILHGGDNNHRSTTTIRPGQPKPHYHRRDYSGASTASSLSVGGFSLSSYERATNLEDAMMTDEMVKSSPKRHKRSDLVIDTGLRPSSALLDPMDDGHEHPTRFEQLSIDAKPCPSTDSESSAGNSNLFLSLSTSPINADVDATPNMKNTAKEIKIDPPPKSNAIFKLHVEDKDRPSDTPTPPVHGELGDSEMNDDHSMLNRHLRGQSFTPLHHLSTSDSGNGAGGGGSTSSPTNTAFVASMAPQLSWSIAGDTPSLGDLAEWEEEATGEKVKATDSKNRPSSTTSTDTRNMMISPHDFQMWKEEHELADQTVSGTTTPLPVFFEQSGNEQSENHMRYENNNHNKGGGMRHPDHMHQQHMMYNNARKQHEHHFWPKHDGMGGMPPTPMFSHSDFRDDGFPGHSPMHGDRRDMDYNLPPYPHHPGSNDRIRNLRGRLPPGAGYPPMPLHIPPHMSSHHLPMTSPMGLMPGKPGMWSPHHGMCPPLGSPHHMGSPLNHMAQSKRKCVPLKPPIPSKFQGDMEKVKSAPVPEFTSLVNFPAHMSQKQSVNLPEGMRCCVMCGQACPCSTGNKGKKCKSSGSIDGSGLGPRNSNGQDHLGDKNSGYAIIPSQNKGLCTLCDVNVWVVANSCLEIKWCKGCKNFRPWAAFGDKGLATKCLRCRERQREKYALQKEEKEKTRVVVPTKVKK